MCIQGLSFSEFEVCCPGVLGILGAGFRASMSGLKFKAQGLAIGA